MPTLAIDKGFLADLVKLEKPVAKRVTEVFDEFDTATHTGLHLEKINNARNPRFRSIRIDQSWRGIILARKPVTSTPCSRCCRMTTPTRGRSAATSR
ncbi:uvrD/REP helicase domain protein [Mycobacterium kansasii]|uniref:UvrD/REP helicase domain protein n=1 Tax=Mycobacterium kansasii TaxID=1768 RepID=A0A1V3WIW3_MYCKA|nr:uvrD/REP helicase domain protein [Mycobacterium kansasii]